MKLTGTFYEKEPIKVMALTDIFNGRIVIKKGSIHEAKEGKSISYQLGMKSKFPFVSKQKEQIESLLVLLEGESEDFEVYGSSCSKLFKKIEEGDESNEVEVLDNCGIV